MNPRESKGRGVIMHLDRLREPSDPRDFPKGIIPTQIMIARLVPDFDNPERRIFAGKNAGYTILVERLSVKENVKKTSVEILSTDRKEVWMILEKPDGEINFVQQDVVVAMTSLSPTTDKTGFKDGPLLNIVLRRKKRIRDTANAVQEDFVVKNAGLAKITREEATAIIMGLAELIKGAQFAY